MRARDRHDEARRLYEQALPVHEAHLPPDAPRTANLVSDLAIVYALKGDNAKAEELFRRAVGLAERSQGPDHPKVGVRLASLGILAREAGRYDEAERLLLRGAGGGVLAV